MNATVIYVCVIFTFFIPVLFWIQFNLKGFVLEWETKTHVYSLYDGKCLILFISILYYISME